MSLGFTFHQPGYYPAFFNLPLERTVETAYIDTTIYPTFYKHIVIEYNVPSDWGSCLFDVYRAETEVGPWRKITPAPTDSNFVIDPDTQDFSKIMKGWYLVECELPDGRRIQGRPMTWENKRSTWVEIRAKEIDRRNVLLLEKFTGIKTLVFRRKHYGMRCPNCWDAATEKVTKDKCSVCLGTSFKGGYFQGFETLFQYDSTPSDRLMDERGKVETEMVPAWTSSVPELNVHDVVLRVPDWKLFRIEHVLSTELQAVKVKQTMNLLELSKNCIEFELAKQAMPEAYQ